MKTICAVIFILLSLPVYAVVDNNQEQSVDDKTTICDTTFIAYVCDGFKKVSDTTNRLFSDDIETGIDNSNTAQNTEQVLLEEDRKQSSDRVAQQWNNILSVLYLLLEAVKILFYAAQLFLLVHLPYFYVKILVWTKNLAVKIGGGRK